MSTNKTKEELLNEHFIENMHKSLAEMSKESAKQITRWREYIITFDSADLQSVSATVRHNTKYFKQKINLCGHGLQIRAIGSE